MRPLHVVAAGSLLGLALSQDESFPVGKVNTIKMYPMTFTEFLFAMGRSQLREAILSADWELLRYLHDLLTEMLRQYYFVGGMPEAVSKWAEQNVKAKSLRTFITNEFPELSLHGLRFSMLPYVNQEWMENFPLSGVHGRFHPQNDE